MSGSYRPKNDIDITLKSDIDIDIMPKSDIRFVLRVPVEIYRELEAVKAAGGGTINQQIVGKLQGRKGEPRVDPRVPNFDQVLEGMLLDRELESAPVSKRVQRAVTRPATPEHDMKACRLYGCLQCKALGWKDEHRGLK